ncbi:MAG: SCP2 sterol-binding domain-containing protein [Acidimicrobiia bacterium]|nr:SCP2 sterol-binding domain-containing protein [Acidimicrobiia bacterium]
MTGAAATEGDRSGDHAGADDLIPYLSDRWLAAANAALADLPPLDIELRVGFVVTGGPEGDREHQLILGPHQVGAERGVEAVSVTMTMDHGLAIEIANGRTSAQRAFLDGRLQLSGSAGALLGHQKALNDIDDRLAALRARTRF